VNLCRNPTLRRVWRWDSHSWNGNLGAAGTPEISEFDYKGQNALHCGVFHIIGKLLKRRCRKWARMSHLDICSTSYGKNKGRESNWQFDSRQLKVENPPDPGACKWSATHRWKILNESYKFAWDLIPIRGLRKELWFRKVAGVQTRIVSGLLLGSPGIKSHLDASAVERRREYYMGGKVVASPESEPWWVLWVQSCLWLVLATRCSRMCTN
jgi:hypothetical protein